MTARCTGGTSAPQPQWSAVVDIGVQMVAAVLAAKGLQWIIPAIPLLNIPPLTLASFCSTDPPTMPTLTTAEQNALLHLTFGADFDSGLVKFGDAVQNLLWDQLCRCTSGTLTPPDVLAPPAGVIIPISQPTASSPCETFHEADHVWSAGQSNVFGGIGTNLAVIHATSMRLRMVNSPATLGGRSVTYIILQMDNTGAVIRSDTIVQGATANQVVDIPWNPLAENWQTQITIGSGGSGTETVRREVDFYCNNNAPGGTVTPCCPPDPATAAQIDLILRMVTLIQRQSAPFAYVYGTDHPSLSGHGSFAVSGLIGVSVDITTLPSSYGRSVGSPEHLYDVGFVTLGTADGYETSHSVSSDGALVLPPSAGVYTSVGYTLSAGVVASIRELVREP